MTSRRTFLLAGIGTAVGSVGACGGGSSGSAEATAPVVPPTSPSAPSSPGSPDAIAFYDGPLNTGGSPPGGISSSFLYQYWLPWKNDKTGDWIDASGVAQGTAPFAQVTATTGATGTTSADVTALLKKTSSIVLRGVAETVVVCNSRESGNGPTIVYETANGPVTVNCSADAECNPSTAYEIGPQPIWTVSSANGSYISFRPPPAGWTKASLVLSLNKVPRGGAINVYQFAWGGISMAGPADTLSLKGDSRVFFETESFEDIPGYLKAMIFGDPVHSIAADVYQQKAVVDTELGRALQVTFDPRVNGALSAAILFPNGAEADEAAWEFEGRLLPDMVTGLTQGFKFFAGASSSTKPDDAYFSSVWKTQVGRAGTLLAGNGGAKSNGNDGWSTRFDMFMSPGQDHPLHGHFAPMQYVYWPEQSSFYGDPHLWNGAGFTPAVNEWHRYTMRLKCNTCIGTNFLKDAEFDAYLDGVLAHRWRGFYLRTTDDPLIMHAPNNVMGGVTYDVKSQLRIGRIWLNTYHGGLALPAARCSFQIRNLRVAKFQ
jgi:hypothetical protein